MTMLVAILLLVGMGVSAMVWLILLASQSVKLWFR